MIDVSVTHDEVCIGDNGTLILLVAMHTIHGEENIFFLLAKTKTGNVVCYMIYHNAHEYTLNNICLFKRVILG